MEKNNIVFRNVYYGFLHSPVITLKNNNRSKTTYGNQVILVFVQDKKVMYYLSISVIRCLTVLKNV